MFERTTRVLIILILYEIYIYIYAGVNQTFTGRLGESDEVTRYEKNENLVYSMKAKGKGAFGGANVVHRPRESRNTALRSVNPSLFVTAITACVTLGWFLGWSLASPF